LHIPSRISERSRRLPNSLSDFRRPRSIAATDSAPDGAGRNGAGHAGELANRILLGLPRNLCNDLLAKAPLVKLPTHCVLNEVNEPIQYFYFINSGLASVLNVLQDGKSVEVGLTGCEGVVGVPIVVGFKTSPTRVVMQIEGSGYRMPAKDLQAALKASSVLEKSLLKYSQELALQACQIAACNRVHEVDERLARWLLMSQDRLGGSLIPLTQEFLAHMLGTRRASVTVAAGILQKAGLISYVRGQLKIEDRKRLESASCECYATLTRQLNVWKSESE
jgi:CRP-like cAMP-binding protein